MTERNKLMKRLAAGVGAFALAAAGLFTAGVDAHAAGGFNDTGSITVHKYAGAPTGDNNDGTEQTIEGRDPLKGVTFTIQEVLYDGGSIDLSVDKGWEDAESLFDSFPPLPAGYTLGTAKADTTGTDGSVKFDDLAIGVYLVTETASGPNLISKKADPFLVSIPMPMKDGSWLYDVHAYPKNLLETVDPTKEVKDPEEPVIGEGSIVDWPITVPVPESDLDYSLIRISDTLDARLSFVEWKSVTLDGKPLAAADYKIETDGQTTTLELTETGLAKLNAKTKAGKAEIVAVLSTKVLSTGDDGVIPNKATVFINDPDNGTDTTKPGDKVDPTTNWGKIRVEKTSTDPEANVDGAEFELYAADKTTLIATGVVENGVIEWSVWVGNDNVVSRDFWIKETKAPVGHVLPADPWTGPITVTAGDAETLVSVVEVTNHKPTGPQLPQTGSSATVVMMLVGLGLVGGAGVLFAARRTRTSH